MTRVPAYLTPPGERDNVIGTNRDWRSVQELPPQNIMSHYQTRYGLLKLTICRVYIGNEGTDGHQKRWRRNEPAQLVR